MYSRQSFFANILKTKAERQLYIKKSYLKSYINIQIFKIYNILNYQNYMKFSL